MTSQNPARKQAHEPIDWDALDPTNHWLKMAYDELRAVARRYVSGERGSLTLQPTELVHEAYLRLVGINRMTFKNKTHFFAVAATQMRRVLVDRARAALAQKRGSRPQRVTLQPDLEVIPAQSIDMLALDEALGRLETRRPRQCRVAEMRLFSGMQVQEIAEALDISTTTAKDDWRLARARLIRALGPEQG